MKKQIFTILGLALFCGLYSQEIPQKISFQGKLLESGSPVTGTKSITFTIGSWSETKNVEVTDGLYSVTLGETTSIPAGVFDNTSSVALQISVEGTALSPQTEILSVPYAYKAEKSVNTEKIGGNIVSTTAPTANQVLKWNGTEWEPQADSSGGLSLPYTVTHSGNGDSFTINKTFGNGSVVTINNDGSSNAMDIYNTGMGRGLEISQDGIYQPAAEISILNVSSSEDALYVSTSGTGNAGYFDGDVEINGNLSKSSGTFKIDHPIDPENKYLYHSFVESPDMMNVYNGNVILDGNGEAIVTLPDYFQALNMEYRYQLTCIGGFAQVYIAEEISDNSFKISGGTPGLKVSWQITGIRKDPYAEQNRVRVEVDKPEEEKGYYLHYKEYNQPIEKSIEIVEHPELIEELNKKEK